MMKVLTLFCQYLIISGINLTDEMGYAACRSIA